MAAPFIGITTYQKANPNGYRFIAAGDTYVQAIQAAGGIPVLIPVTVSLESKKELFNRLDGLLLTGGGDIHPSLFNGRDHPSIEGIDEQRDALELALVREAVEYDFPFFGICRGIQVINVAMGGTLFTDIGDQLTGALEHPHKEGHPRSELAHEVRVEPGTRLESLFGRREVLVNSLHHQGIERLAPGLRPAAYSPDGLIEAVELPEHSFGLGVQWHPEELNDIAEMRALFQAFVEAARHHA